MRSYLYDLVYIISSIFSVYTTYRCFGVFFDRRNVRDKKIEVFVYTGYYFVITLLYFMVNVPIVFFVCNIIYFIGISFLYESTIIKKIIVCLLCYIIFMSVETIVVITGGYIYKKIYLESDYTLIHGIISIRLLSFVVVLIMENFKDIKRGTKIPLIYWVCVILIPLFSLYIILLIFTGTGYTSIQQIVGPFFILSINLIIFYLYNTINALSEERLKKTILLQQNDYYKKHFEIMETSMDSIKALKHDLKNHLATVNQLLAMEEKGLAVEHISLMMDICKGNGKVIYTQNTIIDSILNFKIIEAQQKGIAIIVDSQIPENLTVTSYDMIIILGNTLDNAIEAVQKISEDKKIKVHLKYNKGSLIIKIENKYVGELYHNGIKYLTGKADNVNHGIGLKNIVSHVKLLNGTVNFNTENNCFIIVVMIYVNCKDYK